MVSWVRFGGEWLHTLLMSVEIYCKEGGNTRRKNGRRMEGFINWRVAKMMQANFCHVRSQMEKEKDIRSSSQKVGD